MSKALPLLEQVASFENLALAYRRCARGKRRSRGFRASIFATGEILTEIRKSLLSGSFRWNGYRKFIVHDPKSRVIMAAPYLDRVVHHAIYQIIEPFFELKLEPTVYACRAGKGSRQAVIDLCRVIRNFGPQRYCMKLDVKKYFDSISHEVLTSLLLEQLRDQSLIPLIGTLLNSHPVYALSGVGIPIGNLTSQLFANIYLSSVDRLAMNLLPSGSYYCRYMDDLVLVGKTKSEILEVAGTLVEHAERTLKLSIPFQKRIHVAADPIPFLGFVIHHTGYRVMRRNERRFAKHERRLIRDGALPSRIAQAKQSQESWKNLALGRMHL